MRNAAVSLGALLVVALLGGCGGPGQGPSLNPVDWWHGLEGGAIAETRPPPPNADAPYPNLSTVPPRPPPPDQAAHAQIANALVADRRNAHYEERTEPLPRPPPAAGTPAATLRQGAQPAGGDQPNASLAAASAPPPPPERAPSVRKMPLAPVAEAPLAPPPAPALASPAPAQKTAAAAPPAQAPPEAAAGAPAAAATTTGAEMPAIPAAPPPPPRLAGVATPPAVTRPTPPPVAPPAPPPVVPVRNGKPVPIPFPTGSAVLPGDALPQIKLFVRGRGTASIAVTGFGEATSDEPAAQAAALPLALDRARAVAAVLMADGVPGSAIRIEAKPQGSGAAARLVN